MLPRREVPEVPLRVPDRMRRPPDGAFLASPRFEKPLHVLISGDRLAPHVGPDERREELPNPPRLDFGDTCGLGSLCCCLQRRADGSRHHGPSFANENVTAWGGSHSVTTPLSVLSKPKATIRNRIVEPSPMGPGGVTRKPSEPPPRRGPLNGFDQNAKTSSTGRFTTTRVS